MILTINEIIDIVLMCGILGFVFKDYFKRQPDSQTYDPIKAFMHKDKSQFWFAIAVVSPGIILHEFGHKFVALGFGASATFQAAYTFLLLAVILKLAKSPFLFFVPAYVAWSGANLHPQAGFWIALAGPAVNGLLWLISHLLLKFNKVPKKYIDAAVLTRKINGFLAIFNMIPIPGFDGWHIFSQLFSLFF